MFFNRFTFISTMSDETVPRRKERHPKIEYDVIYRGWRIEGNLLKVGW